MKKYNFDNWSKVLDLTDDEFCKELGCSVSELHDITPPFKAEIDKQMSGNFSKIGSEYHE